MPGVPLDAVDKLKGAFKSMFSSKKKRTQPAQPSQSTPTPQPTNSATDSAKPAFGDPFKEGAHSGEAHTEPPAPDVVDSKTTASQQTPVVPTPAHQAIETSTKPAIAESAAPTTTTTAPAATASSPAPVTGAPLQPTISPAAESTPALSMAATALSEKKSASDGHAPIPSTTTESIPAPASLPTASGTKPSISSAISPGTSVSAPTPSTTGASAPAPSAT